MHLEQSDKDWQKDFNCDFSSEYFDHLCTDWQLQAAQVVSNHPKCFFYYQNLNQTNVLSIQLVLLSVMFFQSYFTQVLRTKCETLVVGATET